jgi:hypothetical protein
VAGRIEVGLARLAESRLTPQVVLGTVLRSQCVLEEEWNMWPVIIRHALINTYFGMVLLLAACTPDDTPLASIPWPKGRVNIAQAARLDQTVSLEIIEEKTPKLSKPAVVRGSATREEKAIAQGVPPRRVTIRDKQTIDQFVQSLNQELRVGIPPACIPQYVFRFHLPNGVIGEFYYMCEPIGPASFIGGDLSDKSFRLGGWVIVPEQFRTLVDAHLAMGAIQDIVSAERQFQSAMVLDVNKNGVGEHGTLDHLQQAELIETLPHGYRFEVVMAGDPARDEKEFFVYGVPVNRQPNPPPRWIPDLVWSQWVRLRPPFVGYTFASDQTGEIRRADLRDSPPITREESRTWERVR